MRFPNYQQLDAMDCGSTCLRIIAKYYGKSYSAQSLHESCPTTHEGVSMLAISDAAESIGFRTLGARITLEQLYQDMPLPCIAHWNQQHFVVIYKIKDGKVYISDPAGGLLEYKEESFARCWISTEGRGGKPCGTVLLLEPTPQFYIRKEKNKQDTQTLGLTTLIKYLQPYKGNLCKAFIGLLLGSILCFILPYITQQIVDIGIGRKNLHFVVIMLLAQIAIVFGQTSNDLIRSWLMLNTATRLSISLVSDFLGKLMRLPIAFFDSQTTGDIMQRIADYSRIQSFLTESLLSIILAGVVFVLYGVIMVNYHWEIFLIFLCGSFLYVIWILFFMEKRRKLDYMRFQVVSVNQSNLVQLITGMQDIKLNNCEKQKRWEWERIQTRLFNISIKSLTLGQIQTIGSTCIDQTKNIAISFLAAKAVINGDMTLGMMTAVQYIIGQLNVPILQLLSFIQETQDAKLSLERLNEIYSKTDEDPANIHKIKEIPKNVDIELRHVTYQYEGNHSEKVLDDISLTIPHGKVTAIVGASGSGKTTLLKMILGFYQPTCGEILLNQKNLKEYNNSAWRANCGTVMQESFIFSDTIINNIGISDNLPNINRVREAIGIVNLEDFISNLPLGLNTKIGMDGHGLSTGQKQRILIARAIYKGADYIILDEATNSLDANNEFSIMNKLRKVFNGKTVIIVAHRLSTIRNADNIIVLDHGKIVENGTHGNLVLQKGYYLRLLKNQLK